MKALNTLVAAALMALAAPSFAGPVRQVLDFETVPVALNNLGTQVNPYADLGVSFAGGAYSTTSVVDVPGGTGRFFREASVYGSISKGAVLMRGGYDPVSNLATMTINFANGFADDFSMLFGGLTGAFAFVEVYSDFNGSGDKLGDSTLDAINADCIDSSGTPVAGFVCNWNTSVTRFIGTARSVRISGSDAMMYLDDFSVGSANPGTIPEPGGIALSLAALGALALGRKRKAKAV